MPLLTATFWIEEKTLEFRSVSWLCLYTGMKINKKLHTHTHTRLTALCPGLPGWAGTRKAKPIWILLKQETVSGSDISWAICKSAPCSRQITTPAPTLNFFLQPNQQRQSTEGQNKKLIRGKGNSHCSFRQVKSMQYESVKTTNVIHFESIEGVCSDKELFKCHLLLSVVLQCTRDDWQQVFPQASTNTTSQLTQHSSQ